MKTTLNFKSLCLALAVMAGLVAGMEHVQAQGYIPSATLSAVPAGGGTYNYTLTLYNGAGATGNIGSFWYAWVPGEFYLPTNPSGVSAPAGWTGAPFPFGGASSIQYSADSPADAILPGGSLSFGFVSTDLPSVLAGNAPNHPGTPIGTSFVYSGGFFSDVGGQFVVQPVPEPSPLTLIGVGALGVAAVGGLRFLKRRLSP
jgi:hypothetical protein